MEFKKNSPLVIILPILLVIFLVSTACLSSAQTPSPAEEQIESAKTMVANLSVEADNAISRGDYYVAAIHLLTLLGNPGIDEKIQSITGKVWIKRNYRYLDG